LDKDRRRKLLNRYRVTSGKGFSLKDHDPADTGGTDLEKEEGEQLLTEGVERLSSLQQLLYADGRWSLLAAFQAMDAAGKDGTIKHVMSGVNPQGVTVTSFKQPGPVELEHDFLWRVHMAVPARGRIGIFNRSHYEEVLVTKVHPELLDKQKLPPGKRGRKFWQSRYEDIVNFELMLARQGTLIHKFFLHVSKEEQRQRFLSRIDEPDKRWKFSPSDLKERGRWDDYQEAYEDAIGATAAEHAPWYVIPADRKWFAHLLVVEAMVEALEGLDLSSPDPADDAALADAKRSLEAEG
jgi:PPK2 family polyphosphate:nucleotide phosphotransferase